MKKRMNLRNVLALSMTAAMVTSTAAFAAETVPAEKLTEATKVEETVELTELTEAEEVVEAKELTEATKVEEAVELTKLTEATKTGEAKEEAEVAAYYEKTGKVTSIEKGEEFTKIMLGEAETGIVLNVKNTTFVMDSKDGSLKSVADLAEGVEVTAVLDSVAPMTMSIPPMTNGVEALVLASEGKTVDLLEFNDELVSKDNFLQLNISEETVISDIKGTKKTFTADDVKGKTAIVIYGAATRSIPAQTTPSNVIILEEKEAEVAPETKEAAVEEATFVGLREVAEKAGYTVKWEANDAPVIITKEGIEIKVTCGSTAVEVKAAEDKATEATLKEAVKLEDSKMIVSADFEDLLK